MAGLDMSSATYARSNKGRSAAQTNLQGDIDKVINRLNGDKYKTFKSTVAKYWVGVDANKFLSKVEKQRTDVQTQIKKLKTVYANALNDDSEQFAKFQGGVIK